MSDGHKWKVISPPNVAHGGRDFLDHTTSKEVVAETALGAVKATYRPHLHANIPEPTSSYMGNGLWLVMVMGTAYYAIEPFEA